MRCDLDRSNRYFQDSAKEEPSAEESSEKEHGTINLPNLKKISLNIFDSNCEELSPPPVPAKKISLSIWDTDSDSEKPSPPIDEEATPAEKSLSPKDEEEEKGGGKLAEKSEMRVSVSI